MRALLLSLLFAATAACGPSGGPPPPDEEFATVVFEYRAPTARNDIPDCGVGETHIHLSWRNYDLFKLEAVGENLWRRTFSRVPANRPVRIRVSDANLCEANPTGAATDNVYANEVKLTKIVMTPGNGDEPGFEFSVSTDGVVTP